VFCCFCLLLTCLKRDKEREREKKEKKKRRRVTWVAFGSSAYSIFTATATPLHMPWERQKKAQTNDKTHSYSLPLTRTRTHKHSQAVDPGTCARVPCLFIPSIFVCLSHLYLSDLPVRASSQPHRERQLLGVDLKGLDGAQTRFPDTAAAATQKQIITYNTTREKKGRTDEIRCK
jgi:hypothetical protein